MPYLVDSDWVIDHLDNVPEALQLLQRLADEGIFLSIITYMEVYEGVDRAADPEAAAARLQAFVRTVRVLPVSRAVAERRARLRNYLRRRGRRVNRRAMDPLIAATALHYNLTLVTRNLDDYDDIPGLDLYREN